MNIQGYVDSNWAKDVDRRRSTSGYVFQLFGGAISWIRKQQVVIALSIAKVEYMVATHAYKEAIWSMKPCSDIGINQRAITIQCDSNNVICLAKNLTFHAKIKHIDVQYHFV